MQDFHDVLQESWPSFEEAFLEGDLYASEMGPLIDLTIQPEPQLLKFKGNEKLDDDKYPYVVVSLINNSNEIGAQIQVIDFKNETWSILSTYLKHVDGRSFNLGQIYLSTDDEDQAMCSVCQVNEVTRVIFPCRHACICQRCFPKLNKVCPMCRTPFDSYFIIQDEDEIEEESQDEQDQEDEESQGRWQMFLQSFTMAVRFPQNPENQ